MGERENLALSMDFVNIIEKVKFGLLSSFKIFFCYM